MNKREFLAGSFAALSTPVIAQTSIDIGLILMSDVSDSVNQENLALQLEGIRRAFLEPRLHNSLKEWNVAACYGEWGANAYIGDWYYLNTTRGIEDFIDNIKPTKVLRDYTSMIYCMESVLHKINNAPFKPDRWVIDISGDGRENVKDNNGVHIARDNLLEVGDLTINGLPIIDSEKDIVEWYKEHVIGGVGAFVQPSNGHQNFIDAIFKKLLREIG